MSVAIRLPGAVSAKSQPLWRTFFWLCILSGIFEAFNKVIDNGIMHTPLLKDRGLPAAAAYLVVGGWTGVAIGTVLAILIGRLLEPKFPGLTFGSWKTQAYAIVTGILSAIATLLVLLSNQKVDAGVLAVFGIATVFVTALYDVVVGQIKLRDFWWPAIGVVAGGSLALFQGQPAILLLALVLVGTSNLFKGASGALEQNGSKANDGVTFFVWRFFWLTAFGSMIAVGLTTVQGQADELTGFILAIVTSPALMFWVVVTMVCVFPAIAMDLVAKSRKNAAVSHVFLLSASIQMGLVMVLTFMGDSIHPNLFGPEPEALWVWGIRILGILVLSWAIFDLRKKIPKQEE